MRKVILGVAVSLDGFIEGPNGEYDWCFSDQDYGMSDFMKRIDTIVMGRKSIEVAEAYKGENPWRGVNTYVFSNTLKETRDKKVKIVSGDVEKIVNDLKKENGKDIWLFGGASLTATLMNLGLVDEFWLAVHPIILGAGKPLFQDLHERRRLKLLSEKVYNTGLLSLWYERA